MSEPNELKKVYPVCFWCGTTFQEAVILGDEFTPEQKGAIPERCVLHYDPCPKCTSEWTQGCVFIEYGFDATYDGQPALERPDGTKFYPTGRLVVLNTEKAVAMFGKDGGDIEPISFLTKENFGAVFEREPEILCFWCGEPKTGVKSAEKRLKSVSDYEPCETCRKKYSGKCVLFECDYAPNQKSVDGVSVKVLGKSMYPTGRLMRLDFKVAARLLGPDTGDFVYVPTDKFKFLSGEVKQKRGGLNESKVSLRRNDDY
ncbi:hypothetical protein AGMMS49975_28920 [Clostridia bacterium]|nr:hypothetical protein AGMMS49975_28920 [Clostridia bacterium]